MRPGTGCRRELGRRRPQARVPEGRHGGAAGGRCLRYLDYAVLGDSLFYVYETSTASGAHELRASRARLQ